MISRGRRVLDLGISAVAGASVLGLTLMADPAVAFAADTALIIGPSEVPVPPQSYIDAADNLYLVPNGYGAYTPQGLTTPEQLWPDHRAQQSDRRQLGRSGCDHPQRRDQPADRRREQGGRVRLLPRLRGRLARTGTTRVVEQSPEPQPAELRAGRRTQQPQRGHQPTLRQGSSLLGQTFNTAPTASTTYPTTVYTQEYDGFADFPQYPLDFLSDLNADLGMFTQHFAYADLTPHKSVRRSRCRADGRHHPVLHDPGDRPPAAGPGAPDSPDR